MLLKFMFTKLLLNSFSWIEIDHIEEMRKNFFLRMHVLLL